MSLLIRLRTDERAVDRLAGVVAEHHRNGEEAVARIWLNKAKDRALPRVDRALALNGAPDGAPMTKNEQTRDAPGGALKAHRRSKDGNA